VFCPAGKFLVYPVIQNYVFVSFVEYEFI
jgi:hypothetical protein